MIVWTGRHRRGTMGLSGNLQSFGVPEILQLLALQRKSGILRLDFQNGERQVLFIERGAIVGTRDRRTLGDDPFLNFLRGAGFLSDDQIAAVLRVQSETSRDPLYILLSAGMIGRDRLIEALTQHTQQIIDRLLTWTEGTYEFSGDERSIPKMGLKLPLSIEEMLMEGMRRMDELATIKQAVLAPDLYLLQSPETIDRGSLSRELLVVCDMVQRSITVEGVVATSPLGEYSTYEAISALLEAGVLIVDPCPPLAPIDLGPAPLELVVPVLRKPVMSTWAGVLVLSAASICLGLALGPTLRGQARGLVPPEVAQARHRMDRALAFEVYQSMRGESATPGRLVDERFLNPPPRSRR